jgi:undecaprenyl diphosphate synthase
MAIPKHVAIIMDGNRRWAKQRGLPSVMGHKKVVEERVEQLIDHAGKRGITHITFWCFSTENWNRPTDEVSGIMNLFRLALSKYARRMIEKGARLRIVGDLSKFDRDIREGIEGFIKESEHNTAITVTFALNYGGRDEIVRATQKLLEEYRIKNKEYRIDENDIGKFLDTAGMPDPDLIIRTSGEQRMSGFMPWQAVYSEYYFTDTLMPDFGVEAFDAALEDYAGRERRRGK